MDVGFEDAPGYLIAQVTGMLSLQAAVESFEIIAAMAKERGAQRVLIDASAITGDMPDLDRYDLGKQAVSLFGNVERIAVVRGPNIRYTGFAFEVAQNRGLGVRAFADRAEAVAWLASA